MNRVPIQQWIDHLPNKPLAMYAAAIARLGVDLPQMLAEFGKRWPGTAPDPGDWIRLYRSHRSIAGAVQGALPGGLDTMLAADAARALRSLSPEELRYVAESISDSGKIVGWADNAAGVKYAFETSPGLSMGEIPLYGRLGIQSSAAYAVNGTGTAAGKVEESGGTSYHAAIFQSTGYMDLGTLGGNASMAWGVNNSETVVGQADDSSGTYHAFSYTAAGGMKDLGTLGGSASYAYAINASGVIVGLAENKAGKKHAFIYADGTMTDLNAAAVGLPTDFTLEYANGISSAGVIVGTGLDGSGSYEAYILTPVSEPNTAVLLAAAGVGLALLKRCNNATLHAKNSSPLGGPG